MQRAAIAIALIFLAFCAIAQDSASQPTSSSSDTTASIAPERPKPRPASPPKQEPQAGNEVTAKTTPKPAVEKQLEIVGDATYIIRAETNTSEGLLELRNVTSNTVRAVLYGTDFTNEFGSRVPGKVLFGGAQDAATKRLYDAGDVPTGKSIFVAVALSELWPVGTSTAVLRCNGKEVGKLIAVKDRFPFNVTPVGWSESVPLSLRIQHGSSGQVVLQNADGGPYGVRWTLNAAGLPPLTGLLDPLAPNGTSNFVLKPIDGWFSAGDVFPSIFREPETDAYLMLQAIPSGSGVGRNWPSRTFRVRLRRAFWSEMSRSLFETLAIIMLLGGGGLTSLLVTHYLPNRLRAARINSDINNLSRRIRRLPDTLRSSVRVGTRVEKQQIADTLKTNAAFSPEFAAVLSDSTDAAARLRREVEALEEIGSLLTNVYTSSSCFVPTVLRDVCDHLGAAQDFLDGAEVSLQDIAAAEGRVVQAKTTFQGCQTLSDDLKLKLTARVAEIQAMWLARSARPVESFMAQRIPSVIAIITANYQNPDSIRQDNFASIDAATAKLSLVFRASDGFPAGQDPAANPLLPALAANLNRVTFRAFVSAESLTRQIRENVQPADLIAALQAGKASILINPPRLREGEPGSFRVAFDDRNLEDAAAKDDLDCRWAFGDGFGEENGWTVSHYYLRLSTVNVVATFRDQTGNKIVDGNGSEVKITQSATVDLPDHSEWGTRTKAEMLRLTVVLFLAVLSLLTGAADQLAKLDIIPGLIAVFVLGFTADQIKNVLAPKIS